MEDVRLAVFDRRAFGQLCSRYPDIRKHLLRTRVDFPGRQPDEVADVYTRRHLYAVVERLFLPGVILTIGIALTFGLQSLGAPVQDVLPWAWVAFLALWLPWAVFLYIDWTNDAFIVTTRRVIRIERVLLIRDERYEAPIDQVISVTLQTPTLMARLLGFGTLLIHTASLGKPIVFDHLAEPGWVQQVILELRDRARAARMTEERGQRRRMLQTKLARADETAFPIPPPLPPPQGTEGVLDWILEYLVPRTVLIRPGEVTWRKHWYVLAKMIALPLLALFLTLGLLLILLFSPPLLGPTGISMSYLIVLGVLALIPLFGWLWWRYEEWRNDIYTITETLIIDRKSAPFGFREQKRVGSLEEIVSVYSDVPNFLAKVINFGHVFIDTAGAPRAYAFESVPNPAAVQQEILSRLLAYREQKSRQESQAEMERWADWFAEYHRLTSEDRSVEGR